MVAAAAYRAGENLLDETAGLYCSYGNRKGVAHKEIMLPEGAPEWMGDRARLWNDIERVERRKDSQLAREIQLALPVELSLDAQLVCLK